MLFRRIVEFFFFFFVWIFQIFGIPFSECLFIRRFGKQLFTDCSQFTIFLYWNHLDRMHSHAAWTLAHYNINHANLIIGACTNNYACAACDLMAANSVGPKKRYRKSIERSAFVIHNMIKYRIKLIVCSSVIIHNAIKCSLLFKYLFYSYRLQFSGEKQWSGFPSFSK